MITPDARLASPRTDYGRSKLVAERVRASVCRTTAQPVTIVYPGGVLGPGQPTLDAMMEGLAGALGSAWPMPAGGVAVHPRGGSRRGAGPPGGARSRAASAHARRRLPPLARAGRPVRRAHGRPMPSDGDPGVGDDRAGRRARRRQAGPALRLPAHSRRGRDHGDDGAHRRRARRSRRSAWSCGRCATPWRRRCAASPPTATWPRRRPVASRRTGVVVPPRPTRRERIASGGSATTSCRALTGSPVFTRIGPHIVPRLDRFLAGITRRPVHLHASRRRPR